MITTLVRINSSTTFSGELQGIFCNFEIFLRNLIWLLCTNITFGYSQTHYDEGFIEVYLGSSQTSAMEHL